jgi:two-component system chemotaxis sensor kinase CheA
MSVDDEIIQCFVVEAKELLETAERSLVDLQIFVSRGKVEEASALESVNLIFRIFHSIKGCAASFGLSNIAKVTHDAENLLQALSSGAIGSLNETLDIILRTTDFLGALIARTEQSGSDAGYEEQVDAIIAELSVGMDKISRSTADRAKANGAPDLTQNEREQAVTLDIPSAPVTPEMTERFVKAAFENLGQMERIIWLLEKTSRNTQEVNKFLPVVRRLSEDCGLMGFWETEELSQRVEAVIEGVRDGDIPYSPRLSSLMLKTLATIRNAVELVRDGYPAAMFHSETMTETLERVISAPNGVFRGSALLDFSRDGGDSGSIMLGEILVARGLATREAVLAAVIQQEKPLGQIMVDMGLATAAAVEEALKIQAEFKCGRELAAPAPQSIRVSVSKLDSLMNLVCKLADASATITQRPGKAELESEKSDASALHFQQIAGELQEVVMGMRMASLSGVFEKLLRVANDISRKNGKKARITFGGEQIELDRRVIELISDPLIHMTRNSLDHGIEHPAERVIRGKPETGHIHIEAKYEGDEVWISIADDGRGLDKDKILSKAVSAKLIRDAENMSDEGIYNLIFESGFSTAEQVTQISGRGVGMSVVQENIGKLEGKIAISSEAGKRTSFIIRIPQKRAIARWAPAGMDYAYAWRQQAISGLS